MVNDWLSEVPLDNLPWMIGVTLAIMAAYNMIPEKTRSNNRWIFWVFVVTGLVIGWVIGQVVHNEH